MTETDPVGSRSLGELEAAAARKVPPAIWDYIQGRAGEERTLRANLAAFRARTVRPRFLADVRIPFDLTTTVLGDAIRLPVLAAPTAYQGANQPGGGSRKPPGRRGLGGARRVQHAVDALVGANRPIGARRAPMVPTLPTAGTPP